MLNADEASRITEEAIEAIRDQSIGPILEKVLARVREAAKAGYRELAGPLDGLNFATHLGIESSVKAELKELGFQFGKHVTGGFDPHDQRESWTVKW